MMVMTAKVDKKKLILVLAGAAILLAGLFWLFGGSDDTPTAAASLASNDGRVSFLKELGWEVAASPKESGQVRLPEPVDNIKGQCYNICVYSVLFWRFQRAKAHTELGDD